jgi:hypothetical protein
VPRIVQLPRRTETTIKKIYFVRKFAIDCVEL